VQIEGNLADQATTRFNLYHSIIATPTHAHLPIGARGLSCQAYQGAAFWDQEIFNLPQFLFTQPKTARNILEYRYMTLDGARKKARDLGYEGAYYAWVSGKTGEELCPSYFFKDVLSNRPIRNHFNDWQIHISPDIVYAVHQYVHVTDDWDFVVQFGAEIAFEVAQFLVSHAYYKKDKGRYEIIRVLGPDEYHENVDNNTFTNFQSRFALSTAFGFYRSLKESEPEALEALCARLNIDESDVANWQEMVDEIHLPQPDPETGLIAQFDGYFDLEDITPDALAERLLDPDEYWGWPNGIAVETQVTKQADILQMFALHDWFPVEVMRTNYDYYEPRTQHGSSLSPSVHALVASWIGYPNEAYRYFQIASTIDLHNTGGGVKGGTFIGGIHTAACGAVWQIIVRGFAGLHVTENGLVFSPVVPDSWESLSFTLIYRGNRLQVTLGKQTVAVLAWPDNPQAVNVQVSNHGRILEPGAKICLDL
jgi:kojibiose phosphorylase